MINHIHIKEIDHAIPEGNVVKAYVHCDDLNAAGSLTNHLFGHIHEGIPTPCTEWTLPRLCNIAKLHNISIVLNGNVINR